MSTAIITVASLLIAVTAVLLTLWQNVLQRRATQAQVFLHMLDQSTENEVSDGLRSLASLKPYETLEAFETATPDETQRQIYQLVDFLNSTASLVEDGYLPRQSVWNLYFMSYRLAHNRLLPWWLQGERARSYPQKFSNFERMCIAVAAISDEAIIRFDKERDKHTKLK